MFVSTALLQYAPSFQSVSSHFECSFYWPDVARKAWTRIKRITFCFPTVPKIIFKVNLVFQMFLYVFYCRYFTDRGHMMLSGTTKMWLKNYNNGDYHQRDIRLTFSHPEANPTISFFKKSIWHNDKYFWVFTVTPSGKLIREVSSD